MLDPADIELALPESDSSLISSRVDPHVRHRLEALCGVLPQTSQDRPLEIVRQRWHERGRWRRLTLHHGRQRLGRCLPAEGPLAGGHLVQHRAEAEDVRARIHGLARRLFRRHVGQRAHPLPGIRQVLDQCVDAEGSDGSSSSWSNFASPKSSTFTAPSVPTITLAGFRSRWMIPRAWAAASASATAIANPQRLAKA